MSYTVDNPKLVESYSDHLGDKFTGVVKDKRGNIAYYKNGRFHREDGPATECPDGVKFWSYNGEYYGANNDFTVESWIKKWRLEIFK